MEKSYKFRLYPNAEQICLIEKTFGCTRYMFNHFLARRIERYQQSGESTSFFDQNKELTILKQELPWLKEPDKHALQNSLRNLDAAYKNFFR